MFTGIVLEVGRLLNGPVPSGRGGVRLRLGHGEALAARLEIGASLAVCGVCLTITALDRGVAEVELGPETVRRTRLARLRRGDRVNLEPALRLGDALGGHWVQGHVDGTIRLLDRRDLEQHRELTLELPTDCARYVAEKGSVALDGVSLTVARRLANRFSVALLPLTLDWTTLGELRTGDLVHLEVDILAKYVEQLLDGGPREARGR